MSVQGVTPLPEIDSPRVHVRHDKNGNTIEYWIRGRADDPDVVARRGWRAMMLAPTLEIYRALLAGESVPAESLDQTWVARFGRRPL